MIVEHAVLYSADTIQREVGRLAARIDSNDIESYVVVTVLKGAAIFSSDLVRQMETDTELVYITASSSKTSPRPKRPRSTKKLN